MYLKWPIESLEVSASALQLDKLADGLSVSQWIKITASYSATDYRMNE
jgi:hypothetical protein